jgi:TPR repeat protein
MVGLAKCHINGWECFVDKERARELLTEAARLGDPEARELLKTL